MSSNTLKIAFVVCALAASAVLIGRWALAGGPADESLSQTTYWLCLNDSCNAEFTRTLGQVKETSNDEGAVECPECGKHMTSRGWACPSCKRHYRAVGHGGLAEKCPHCGVKIVERGGEGAAGG